jgi:hypothetical protein
LNALIENWFDQLGRMSRLLIVTYMGTAIDRGMMNYLNW